MKKIAVAVCAVMMGVMAANAECIWSWWTNSPSENASKNVQGCALGIASEVASVKGAQVSLLFNITEKVRCGAQVAIGYNQAETVKNGPQVGFVNKAKGAALQFGLLNFNEEGFLPVFPFFNFSTKYFGAVD